MDINLQPTFKLQTTKPPKTPEEMLREDSQSAVMSVIMTLVCGNLDEQVQAINMLNLFAENTKTIISCLIEIIDDKHTTVEVKTQAIKTVGILGKTAFTAIPSLVMLLNHSSWDILEATLDALASMGILAKCASKDVAKLSRKGDYPCLRDKATKTLNLINKPI